MSIFDRAGNSAHRTVRLWSKLICRLSRVKFKIIGLEYILNDTPQILVSNHQSWFDVFVLTSLLPIKFSWIVKKELFSIPLVGRVMRCAGYISIDRSDREKAYRSMNKAVEKIKQGESIAIFPEGTRSLNGKVGRFKKGILFLTSNTDSLIVPISLSGTYQIMRKNSVFIEPGREVRIIIDRPLEAKKFREKGEQALEELRETIISNLS